jgi:hypothetical protein
MGENGEVLVVLFRKSEGKRSLGRLKRRWGDNNKTDLAEIRWCGLDWINFARVRDGWSGRGWWRGGGEVAFVNVVIYCGVS